MQKSTGITFLLVTTALLAAGGCNKPGNIAAFIQARNQLVAASEYYVYPPDVLTIQSVQVAEINNVTQRVRPDGKINLPLIGEVDVTGKTPKEISLAIQEKAQEYYAEVDATVDVAGYNSQQFFIFGEVGRPGPMSWTGNDTVLDALAIAQPTQHSWPQRIKLIRAKQPQRGGQVPPSKEELKKLRASFKAGGKNKVGSDELTINLAAMFKQGDMSRNVLLKPGDILYIPQNPWARTGFFLQMIFFPVNQVLEPLSIYAGALADLEYLDRDN